MPPLSPHPPGSPSPGAVGPLTHACVPAVSLENVLLDVKELGRGMELLRRECGLHENSVLRAFLAASEGKLERLQKDARTAEVRAAGRLGLTRPLHTPCFARSSRTPCFAQPSYMLCFAHSPCFARSSRMPCLAHPSCQEATRSPGTCSPLVTAPSLVPGRLQHRGAVFRREPQDDPPIRLLPSVCPVHPLLQSEEGPGGDMLGG